MSQTTLVLLYVAFWTVLGLQNALAAYLEWLRLGRDIAWWRPLTTELSSHYMHAALAPLVWRFALRHRLDDSQWLRRLPAYAAALVAYSLIHTSTMVAIRKTAYAAAGYRYVFGPLTREVPYELIKDTTAFAVFVIAAYGFHYYRQMSALRAGLAEAQLARLETQLHPHFLYNTLNTISSVMYTDVQAADRMIAHLGDLLRDALARDAGQLVPLEREEAFLSKYLDIMRARFDGRLNVTLHIDQAARGALVPRLLLQPLVENAIQHAIAPRTEGGRIAIRASRHDGRVELAVQDDGPGIGNLPAKAPGIGLRNTAERLQHLYGADQRFEIANADGGGVLVTVVVPYRTDAEAAS